jgi:hypothetical protein
MLELKKTNMHRVSVKGPKHVVGTLSYVTNIVVFLTDTLRKLVYLRAGLSHCPEEELIRM